MLHEHVILHEGPRVAQQTDPLSGGQLALLVLGLDPLDSSAEQSLVSFFLNLLFHPQSLLGTYVCRENIASACVTLSPEQCLRAMAFVLTSLGNLLAKATAAILTSLL